MKTRRLVFIFIILGLIMMGACGCMNHQDYSDKILAELKGKYSKDFEIVKLSYEVDGESGNYYRAVCKEQGDDQTFVAYYYLNGSQYLLQQNLDVELNKPGQAVLVDEYPVLLLNKAYAGFLEEKTDILFAISDVNFISHILSKEDVDQGLEHCLFNGEYEALAKVYLFVDNSHKDEEKFEAEVVTQLSGNGIFQQSIDVVYISDKDMEAVRSEYQDDTYLIRDKLKEDSRVTRYSWYLAEAGKGIVSKNDVEGG
jgi:hypothetical protein